MAFALVIGWFSASEVVPFLVAMALAVAALIYNKPLARALANLTGGNWPPGGLIREDRPERIEERRQLHQTALVMTRVIVVLAPVLLARRASQVTRICRPEREGSVAPRRSGPKGVTWGATFVAPAGPEPYVEPTSSL